MKVYTLIEQQGVFKLRERNPLENQRYLVSNEMYRTHEAQYEAEAVQILNPIFTKKDYVENELKGQWQFNTGNGWVDISEPNFIGTQTEDYRYVFIYIGLLAIRSYQDKCKDWLVECFGPELLNNIPERCLRFLEEALELVQACGLDQIAAQRLVTYVYNREIGNRAQETGGVMLTLATLSTANGLDMREEGEIELNRVMGKMDEIREKQKYKNQQGITA